MKLNRKTLLTLVLALALAGSILTSGTIAWFTDEVASTGNKIEAGTLDIELYQMDKNGAWQNISNSTEALFTGNLWEPGYTTYRVLKVVNEGSLALKWKTQIINNGEMSKLAEAIDVYVSTAKPDALPADREAVNAMTKQSDLATFINNVESTTIGKLEPGDEAYLTLALKMREEAGNEYQGLTLGDFDVKILAAQDTVEFDGFGTNDYDEDATYYQVVNNAEELTAALQEGKNVSLANDMTLETTAVFQVTNDQSIDLNNKQLKVHAQNSGASKLFEVQNGATLTISGGTIDYTAGTPDTQWGGEGQKPFPGYANNTIVVHGKLVIDNATIMNSTAPGGASYAIDCYPGADLVINSGLIDGVGKCAIRMFANSTTVPTKVTINGGTITGKRGIWVQLPSSNVTPQMADLTINGGTIEGTAADDCALYSYSYGSSFAKTNITITGGTFNGDVQFGGGYKGDQETVTITGGTFNGELGRWLANDGWEDIAKP